MLLAYCILETVAMKHTATAEKIDGVFGSAFAICVRIRKSNFWENSFTTVSLVPVSRVSIQVYSTQVKITPSFLYVYFIFFIFFFYYLFVVCCSSLAIFPFSRFSVCVFRANQSFSVVTLLPE